MTEGIIVMQNRFKDVWYYKHAKFYLQQRNIGRACESFYALVKIAPIKAFALLLESVYKIVFPLGLRCRILFWIRRTFQVAPSFYQSVTERGISDEDRKEYVVVTLTSYPKRIETVYKVINTLLSQTYKPDKVILWLAPEQFPNKYVDLPKTLLDLCQYGLTIDWYHDIKSFKKLVPALLEYPNALLVTADDDIYYPPDWLEKLVVAHKKYPYCVLCHSSHKIRVNNYGMIEPYKNWRFGAFQLKPSFDLLQVGYGGVLYAPNSLHKDVLKEELFMNLCPYADDIWFWAMAVLNGTQIKVIDNHIKNFNSVYETDNSEALSVQNMMEGNRNDLQLKNVVSYYSQLMQRILRCEKKTNVGF